MILQLNMGDYRSLGYSQYKPKIPNKSSETLLRTAYKSILKNQSWPIKSVTKIDSNCYITFLSCRELPISWTMLKHDLFHCLGIFIQVRDLEKLLVSGFISTQFTVLAIAALWKVNQWMEDLFALFLLSINLQWNYKSLKRDLERDKYIQEKDHDHELESKIFLRYQPS